MYSMIFMEQDSLLDCGEFAAVKLIEEIGNSASSLAMVKARGGDMMSWPAASISKRSGRSAKAGSLQNLEPPFGGRSLDRDRHTGKIRQKWKKA